MAVLKRLYHALGNDGQDYEVHVYVEPACHSNAFIERLERVCLADGRGLDVIARRHYRITGTDILLEANDAGAV